MKQAYEMVIEVPAYSNTYTVYADNASEAEELAHAAWTKDNKPVELEWFAAQWLRTERDLTEEEVAEHDTEQEEA